MRRSRTIPATASTAALLILLLGPTLAANHGRTIAFTTNTRSLGSHHRTSNFLGRTMRFAPTAASPTTAGRRRNTRGETKMFLGTNDGGILGVGTPEVFTILLVGYFVLGPSDLYKLVKEIGKQIQNFRTLGAEATKGFEDSMENQLQIQELRKAQQELNDAFSFRRSINVDEDAEFPDFPEAGSTAVAAASAGNTTSTAMDDVGSTKKRKRKKVRKVKKKVAELPPEEAGVPAFEGANGYGQIEDLDMAEAVADASEQKETDDAARRREERIARLEKGTQPSPPPPAAAPAGDEWYSSDQTQLAEQVLGQEQGQAPPTFGLAAEEQERFAAQLSEKWNEQVLANEDKLSPLAMIMERLSILEEEKKAADQRLEEEFQLRVDLEEKYYRNKRDILEEAAAEVQANAYVGTGSGGEDATGETTASPQASEEGSIGGVGGGNPSRSSQA